MIRRATVAAALVLGAACLNTSGPHGFVFRYQLRILGCATTCDTAGTTPVDTAQRGDTVWLEHFISLVGAVDSVTPQTATLRADCAGHIAILSANTTVRTIPPPTCGDSTYEEDFTLIGTPIKDAITIYTQWVVDQQLSAGFYTVRGRVMVQPRVEPSFGITVQ
jgi:hypothetical protein